ncbi:hypothetical protein SRHO_G00304220 [Serrasalmus rhombeus]
MPNYAETRGLAGGWMDGSCTQSMLFVGDGEAAEPSGVKQCVICALRLGSRRLCQDYCSTADSHSNSTAYKHLNKNISER